MNIWKHREYWITELGGPLTKWSPHAKRTGSSEWNQIVRCTEQLILLWGMIHPSIGWWQNLERPDHHKKRGFSESFPQLCSLSSQGHKSFYIAVLKLYASGKRDLPQSLIVGRSPSTLLSSNSGKNKCALVHLKPETCENFADHAQIVDISVYGLVLNAI